MRIFHSSSNSNTSFIRTNGKVNENISNVNNTPTDTNLINTGLNSGVLRSIQEQCNSLQARLNQQAAEINELKTIQNYPPTYVSNV